MCDFHLGLSWNSPVWGMEPFDMPLRCRRGGIPAAGELNGEFRSLWSGGEALELSPWDPSLAGGGGGQWRHPFWPVPELCVLIHPLWFDFQALWGWQQLLPWQRVKNESDHMFLNPTHQSARGSRRVCYGKDSRLHS